MKAWICSSWVLGLVLLVLPLAGCLQESSFSPNEAVAAAAEPSTPPESSPPADSLAQASDTDPDEVFAEADEQNIANAPVQKVSTEIQVPANLKPSAATAEIIKLANAGVEENVMLSFVTNSVGTFNLRAEEIIYLNDIGVPSRVVTAMIQRDYLLQASSGDVTTTLGAPESAPAPPAYPEQPFVASEPPPTISDTAPDYNSGNYATPVESEPSPSDYADYYDSLTPYGNWVDVGGAGRCWQPTVAIVDTGWRPYFNCGRWVYTDCGWYWMSDYSWGWAPFHYGRWFQHASLGWCWRPDRVWGPSWVCWRQSGDYCGWAPLPPGARFVAGVGLTFRSHPVRHNFSFGLAANHFRFIPTSHFLGRDLARHVLSRDHAERIFQHTVASTGIVDHNHHVSNNGIPREHIASAVHANIIPATLRNVTPTEGVGIRERFERNGRTLAVFRPDLQQRISSRLSAVDRENQVPSNPSVLRLGIQTQSRVASQSRILPATQPAPSLAGRTDAPVRAGQPLIVRGHGNPGESSVGSAPNPQPVRRSVPLNSVVGQNRDSRVAAAESQNRPSWNSNGRSTPSYNRDYRRGYSQALARDDQSDIRQPQAPTRPSDWWAQPQQPRNASQEQFRHNRDMPVRGSGTWNTTVEPPRYNSTPIRTPEHSRSAPIESYQPRPAPVESRPTHNVPMESHQSRSVESRPSYSPPPVSQPSHSAPAPSSSSSSSSHDTSSHSSGRGR